jgi:Flp pilus assembly protein TadB
MQPTRGVHTLQLGETERTRPYRCHHGKIHEEEAQPQEEGNTMRTKHAAWIVCFGLTPVLFMIVGESMLSPLLWVPLVIVASVLYLIIVIKAPEIIEEMTDTEVKP